MNQTISIQVESPVCGTQEAWASVPDEPAADERAGLMERCRGLLAERDAVRINAGRAELEVSGGVDLDSVGALAQTGVDRISVGKLTKDVTATDYSMRFAGV